MSDGDNSCGLCAGTGMVQPLSNDDQLQDTCPRCHGAGSRAPAHEPPCDQCGATGNTSLDSASGIRLCIGPHVPAPDLNLLRALTGEGGRRTGVLRRAGFLTWQVTPAGYRALGMPVPEPKP